MASLSLCCSVYWDYAMTIRLEEIVYLHCHQQGKATPGAAGGSGTWHLIPYLWDTVLLHLQGSSPEFWVVTVI